MDTTTGNTEDTPSASASQEDTETGNTEETPDAPASQEDIETENTQDTPSVPALQDDKGYLDFLLTPLLTAAEQEPQVEMFEKLLANIDEHSQEPEYKRVLVRLLEMPFGSALREDGDVPCLSNNLIRQIRDAAPSLTQQIRHITGVRTDAERFSFFHDPPIAAAIAGI